MTATSWFFAGLMVAYTPCLLWLAYLAWRAPPMCEEDEIPDDWRANVEERRP